MSIRHLLAAGCLLVLPLCANDGKQDTDAVCKEFHQLFQPVLKKYFPDATTVVFENQIHFEHDTRLFIDEIVAKLPFGAEPIIGLERGPKADGVFGHISCKSEASRQPAPARAEGTFKRKHFSETMLFHVSERHDVRFDVMLRLPEDGKKSRAFLKELKAALQDFGKPDKP